nr:MAG: hypothetical protein 1 [Marnaviridae sp.]
MMIRDFQATNAGRGVPIQRSMMTSEPIQQTNVDVQRVVNRAMAKTPSVWTRSFSDRAKEFAFLKEYHDGTHRTRKSESPEGLSQRYLKQFRSAQKGYNLQSFEFDPMTLLTEHTDPEVVSFVEDVALLCVQLLRAQGNSDRILALSVFIKLRTGTPLIYGVSRVLSDVLHDIFHHEVQVAEDNLLDAVTDFRSFLGNWNAIKESSLVQQVMRVYRYAVALGVFTLVGIPIDEKVASACRKEVDSPLMGPNFLVTLFDTVALFVQRALLYCKTGSWDILIHGPSDFGKWFDACQKLKREYQFRGDLESQGTSYHQFMADLKHTIDEGVSILKYGTKASGYEHASIKKMINDLLLIKAEISTFREAQKSRRPPFALLVHGKTCVGKSTFTNMLFQYAGKVLGLPTDDEFKYTRNTCDDFWSGWDSMKWFLLLDDIAFTHPDGKIVDNSLNEVIQIMNDVPLVPNQASLEDKGKNPVRARMCVATTNTKHLNAFAYFSCPIAVQRRFPFVLTVVPQSRYARDDDPEMIDPAKLPPITDDWPDFWRIDVERVVANGTMAKYETVHQFTSVKPFLKWLAHTILAFENIQQRARAGVEAMQQLEVCRLCFDNAKDCDCLANTFMVQASEVRLPKGKRMGDTFDLEDRDGTWCERTRFFYSPGETTNYVGLTTVESDGVVTRKYATPVKVVAGACVQSCEGDAERIAMADVIAEIVREQKRMQPSKLVRCVHWSIERYLEAYVKSRLVRSATHYVMEWSLGRRFILWGFKRYTTNNSTYFKWLGDVLKSCYMTRRWRHVLYGLGAVSTAVLTYGIYKSFGSQNEVQGLRMSADDSIFPKSERVNVWKRDDYETSTFDKTPVNTSMATLPYDQVMRIVERNTARIRVSNGERVREGNVFSPCGHLWVTNNHTLFTDGDLEVTLSVVPHVQGASPNVTMKLRQTDIYRNPSRDLAFFEVFSWETRRDLRELVRKPTLRGAYTATYVTRDKGIATKLTKVRCASLMRMRVPELNADLEMWSGSAECATTVGDCGSPLVTHQPVATILGLHTLGNSSGTVWAVTIDTDIIEAALAHFKTPVVQCGTPVIDAPSRPKKLGPLRQKSPLRWLEQGTIATFGSYLGQGPTSRSKVKLTLLGKEILADRKWSLNYAAPDLRDWRPWRFALIDSTQKKFGALSPSIMNEIARAFSDDILDGLSSGDLRILEPLSHKATINGIPGVRFVDKMNFKTSMGEPYNKSKKFFLSGVEGDMDFNDEVLDRISHIESCYAAGVRACPVFGGQLKDEPRGISKVEEGKVRVFLVAPADWSFVVRKYLLPFVKLMQEHPFLFESSPGCTVQSLEWQQYFVHLTQFGYDRMVCGDYGKFDKRAEALIILLAFRVVRRIYEAAGWSENELRVIDCIAEDTAYAFANFDGDLVMFFGSNPSGHPLTVIINCIINALYMRYAYVKLKPNIDSTYAAARTFKTHVRLLTYGDDNVMNVSPLADWFNHTAIQAALATIGVEYTMADKESHSRPFIHISEVTYLKRRWRWDDDIGAVVAPLEEDSIRKMLTICLPSGTESPELHMASVMVSAINEWFWYGKSVFERERQWMLDLADRHNLQLELVYKGFPTYQDLYDRFWEASKNISAQLGCELEHPRSVLPK